MPDKTKTPKVETPEEYDIKKRGWPFGKSEIIDKVFSDKNLHDKTSISIQYAAELALEAVRLTREQCESVLEKIPTPEMQKWFDSKIAEAEERGRQQILINEKTDYIPIDVHNLLLKNTKIEIEKAREEGEQIGYEKGKMETRLKTIANYKENLKLAGMEILSQDEIEDFKNEEYEKGRQEERAMWERWVLDREKIVKESNNPLYSIGQLYELGNMRLRLKDSNALKEIELRVQNEFEKEITKDFNPFELYPNIWIGDGKNVITQETINGNYVSRADLVIFGTRLQRKTEKRVQKETVNAVLEMIKRESIRIQTIFFNEKNTKDKSDNDLMNACIGANDELFELENIIKACFLNENISGKAGERENATTVVYPSSEQSRAESGFSPAPENKKEGETK